MEKLIRFNNEAVVNLFIEGLISAPLNIRADFGELHISAWMEADGSINLGTSSYTDIQQAMDSIELHQASTSNAWQFWTWFSEERQAWTPLEHLRAKLASKDNQSEVRTSDSHPLRIESLAVPNRAGRIGLTFCPGKCSDGLYGGKWERNLNKDIQAIVDWGGKALISLMEDHEFPLLGVPEFAETLNRTPIAWLHLPIKDMQTPNEHFESLWRIHGPTLHELLANGKSIVIHCRGGLGRTGLLAARMLVEAGVEPAIAVARVRVAREHSIETYAQEFYVLSKRWKQFTI